MLKKLFVILFSLGIVFSTSAQSREENWKALNQKALELYRQGRYKEAIVYAEKVVEDVRNSFGISLGFNPDYAISLNNLALMYYSLGRYEEAEPLYKDASLHQMVAVGKNHPEYATTLNNMALLYERMGRYDKAMNLHTEALEIREAKLGENHPTYANSLGNLAGLYTTMGRFSEAEPLYTKALEIIKVKNGENHSDYANYLAFLAGLYTRTGRYAEAEPLILKANEIMKGKLDEGHPGLALLLNGLAELYHKMGRYTEAKPLYIRALGIRKTQLGENHPDYATSLNNLAELYESMGLYAEAEQLLLQDQQMYQHHLKTIFLTFTEKEKEQFLNTFNFKFERFHSFALKRQAGNPAITAIQYNNTLSLKGVLLQSSSQLKEIIFDSKDTTAIQLLNDWKMQKRQLLQESKLSSIEKQINKALGELDPDRANTLEKELINRLEAFAKETDTIPTTWREVRQELQQGDAAIELVRYRWHDKNWTDTIHYAALILTPDTKDYPHLVVLKNGNELEEQGAQSYQSAYATRGASLVTEGKKPIPADSLYAYFWQPIQAALDSLGGAKKIYLSADGVYHTLNLLTLKNPETGKFLLETIDLQRLGSTKDLVQKKKSPSSNKNAVLAGYPTYTALAEGIDSTRNSTSPLTRLLSQAFPSDRTIDSARYSISPLPGTLTEVEQVASILHREGIPTYAMLENAASEDVLKNIKSPRILHIATHGFFEPESEQKVQNINKRMLMSGFGQEIVSEIPYLRSGLYLAGAETTLRNLNNPDFRRPEGQEDGILTAYEATLLDLRGTELVVLSACETGLGVTKNGEGVYGLQRAFQVAGAETVIFSLWKVADQQTQEMMGLFYGNWLGKGMSKREAFKAAQKTIKEKYEDPFFWGAFVMIGG
ncbi:CHAT domain-containing protein [Cyclobacterium plantarum]|uniref:CHAT domain-containing protein n=1 Tax=Cyclobacterium plantarum TaxID=2716263 RepID=A0ABX0HG21_9BACT|nr:CHAT domain-containing tetratricopeptide repeat protein [Cyclobacterium plantarum]NHE58970.1 CHAT domain-containing protein [Cyclobacterium plantarum]